MAVQPQSETREVKSVIRLLAVTHDVEAFALLLLLDAETEDGAADHQGDETDQRGPDGSDRDGPELRHELRREIIGDELVVASAAR